MIVKIILCCLYFSTKCYILRRCKDDLWKLRKNKMKQKLNNITLLFVLVLMTLPNLGQLIFGLPTGTKQLVRRYERCSFKIIRAKCGQTFNSMCIREGFLPKYSNICIRTQMENQRHRLSRNEDYRIVEHNEEITKKPGVVY